MLESIKFMYLHDRECTVGEKIKNKNCRLPNHRIRKKKRTLLSYYQQIYGQ